MVACGGERVWEAGENSGGVVSDGRGLAVHEASSANDLASENFADALVPEANTQERQARAKSADDAVGNTRLCWGARARRNDDSLGLERLDFRERNLVVTLHKDLCA